jgi:hypothetical protein
MSDKFINRKKKIFGSKGYCCEMDSGPYNKYIKNNRGNKRLRQFLKKIIKLEIKNDET